MPIEINGYSKPAVQNTANGVGIKAKRDESASTKGEAEQSTVGDSVSLTETAARLRDLESSVANLPEVDIQRVEKVRNAITAGSYQVNSPRVADKLASFENALTGKVQK